MPSRRTAVNDTSAPRPRTSRCVRPMDQAPGGSTTVCSSSRNIPDLVGAAGARRGGTPSAASCSAGRGFRRSPGSPATPARRACSSAFDTSVSAASSVSGTTSVAPAASSSSRCVSSMAAPGSAAPCAGGARPGRSRVSGRVREGDDHGARAVEAGGLQHAFIRGVPVDHRVARRARGAHAHRVEVHREEFEALALEHAADVLADAAVPAEDHVLARRERLVRGLDPRQPRLDRPGLAQDAVARCACCAG